MFFYISKILSFLLNPLIWVFILLIAAYFHIKEKRPKKLVFSTIVLLYLFSNSSLFHIVNSVWSEPAIKLPKNSRYKYAIVLGGMANFDDKVQRIRFSESADRLFQAIYLYKTNQVEKIIISGGSGAILYPNLLESELVKEYLLRIDIPQKDILIENKSKNTHENAVYTADLLKNINNNDTCILITSAMHMPRAKSCFIQAGIKILPYPALQILDKDFFTADHLLLPQSEMLSNWGQLLHEIIGYIVYWINDYI